MDKNKEIGEEVEMKNITKEENKGLIKNKVIINEEDEEFETKAFLKDTIMPTNMKFAKPPELRFMGDNKDKDDIEGVGGLAENGKRGSNTSGSKSDPTGWRRYLGVLYTLLSTNSFSLSSTILKKYSHISPFTLGVFAFPLAAVFSIPFIVYTVCWEKKSVTNTFWPIMKHKKVAFFIWFRATASAIISYTIILSLKYISVADTRTIMAASVITVYIAGWIFLGEKCGIIPIIVAILALCGIGVMTRPPVLTGAEEFDNDTLIGVSFAVCCLLLATVIIVTLRYLQHVHHGVLNFLLYAWAFSQSFVLALATNQLTAPASLPDTFAIASIGLLMACGNLFLVLALQAEEAGVVALIRTSEVIFTFFWQYIVLGINPDLLSILGASLVLTGVIVVTLRKWVDSLKNDNPTKKKLAFLLM